MRHNEPESGQQENTVTEVTRRAIMDQLSMGGHWASALNEDKFLARLYPLDKMPSSDRRAEYNTAARDIWKHRTLNTDWPDDWVFMDSRFNLLHGPDEAFLRFLAETVHPIVRPDSAEAAAMVDQFNTELRVDGWEIFPAKEISGRPVFSFRRLIDGTGPHLEEAERVAGLTGTYVEQKVQRLRDASEKDPEGAIGTAKEFLETVCKTILSELNSLPQGNHDLPALVKMTVKRLPIVPEGLPANAGAERTVAGLLSSLSAVAQQLAEMRNQFGTGHGKVADHVGLQTRHSRLAFAAASAVAVFLYDCHETHAHPAED